MLLQRSTTHIVMLTPIILLSSTIFAAPLTAPLTLFQNVFQASASHAPVSVNPHVTEHRNTLRKSMIAPAQDFAARQARLIVSSLVEEAELFSHSVLKTQPMLSEYRH